MRLLFATVSVILLAACASASSVPLLLWSALPYFPSHSVLSASESVNSMEAMQALIQPVISAKGQTLVEHVGSEIVSSPELLIAFLLPEFSSAELSYAFGAFSDDHSSDSPYAFLKESLSASSSSITVMESTPIYSEHEIMKIVQAAEPRAHTVNAQCDNALVELNRLKELSSNGHTDLLVVSVTSSSQAAECVKSVLNGVADTTYVAMLSAKQAHAVRRTFGSNVNSALSAKTSFLAQAHTAHSASNLFSVQGSSSASASYSPYGSQSHPAWPASYVNGTTYLVPGPLYILPSITLGLIVGLFLVVILLIGLCCITDIERPVRMTNTPIQIPKEY